MSCLSSRASLNSGCAFTIQVAILSSGLILPSPARMPNTSEVTVLVTE